MRHILKNLIHYLFPTARTRCSSVLRGSAKQHRRLVTNMSPHLAHTLSSPCRSCCSSLSSGYSDAAHSPGCMSWSWHTRMPWLRSGTWVQAVSTPTRPNCCPGAQTGGRILGPALSQISAAPTGSMTVVLCLGLRSARRDPRACFHHLGLGVAACLAWESEQCVADCAVELVFDLTA
jgi:hypothetical protein